MGSDELRPAARQFRAASPASIRVAWLYVALWIVVILLLGSDLFSSSETSRFLGPLLHWLFPDASPELLGRVQFAIRKAAHVVEYGILALLCIRAWRLSYGWSQSITALASVAVVVAVAAVDELRQAQTADRSGATADVLLDALGGVSALLGGRFAARWFPQ